jgi:hypothetical protein
MAHIVTSRLQMVKQPIIYNNQCWSICHHMLLRNVGPYVIIFTNSCVVMIVVVVW